MRLLERRTAIYTMGDSTSVPKHVAVDLLRSVCFVLGIDPERPEIPERLLSVDLEDEFRRRLADIERKVELSRRAVARGGRHDAADPEHRAAGHDREPSATSRSVRLPLDGARDPGHASTTRSATRCPSRSLGVDYINEYLRRLLIEADFLRRFDADACMRVLERSSPDYVDLLVNLYEPVATNAIGRALVGQGPAAAAHLRRGSCRDRDGGWGRWEPRQRGRVLREAASVVCETLGIDDAAATEYLRALAPELLPRIEVATGPR